MTVLCQRCAPLPHDQRTAKVRAARARGFSAVELLVVLAIAGILAVIAIPSLQSMMQANRISGELNTLINDLQYARAEALRTGQFVSVCTSSDGATCSTGSGGDWRNGWILFSDPNGNRTVDSGEAPLRVRRALTNTDTLQTTPTTSAFSFNRNGSASGLNNDFTVIANTNPGNTLVMRCLAINVVGRLQMQTPSSNPTTCR